MGTFANLAAFNDLFQPAPGTAAVSQEPVLYNRRCRRAMRKRRSVMTGPLAATPRLGTAPRGPARRQRSGTSGMRRGETGSSRAGMPPPPTFTPIPSQLAFGSPADISMGWDGTLWAIDAGGAPHLFDPINNAWQPHGDGIDAAAWVGTTYYFFRGSEVVTAEYYHNTGTPQSIAALFPNLPDSFKLGVTAAANIGGKLYLFKGGWYLPTDGSAPRAKLTDLKNWPQTPNWIDGVIDATSFDGGTVFGLIRGGEYITVNFAAKTVTTSPAPIGSFPPWQGHLPAEWAASGFDAAFTQSLNNTTVYTFFKGTAMVEFQPSDTGTATQKYLGARYPNWPATWHPVLNHAPSGRVGNLWVSANGGRVLRHDGDTWNVTPGVGLSAAVGQDGSVFVIGTDGGLFQWDGTQFNPQGNLGSLVQVAVGDANHVWVRDGGNTVHRYQGNNTFAQVDLGAGIPNPTHMAANADGTLWHVNSSNPNAYRLISGAGTPTASAPIQVQGGGVVTNVNKIATTGFGAAACLATRNGGDTQVYAYDSPYLFKTAANYAMLGTDNVTGAQFAQGLGHLYFVQFVSYPGAGYLAVRFVALDAHTGLEITSNAPLPSLTTYTGMVFDPINNLVYVGTSPYSTDSDQSFNQTTPGQLIALDARTLEVKWTFTASAGIDAVPALNGTQLCFGDRQGNLYAIDTRAALASAPAAPTAQWKIALPVTQALTHRVTTPLYTNGLIYVAFWDINVQCDACLGPTVLSWAFCNGDGTNLSPIYSLLPQPVTTVLPGMLQSPALGRATFNGVSQLCLFVNGTNAVYAASLVDPVPNNLNTFNQFNLPSGSVVTGFTYDDGTREGSGLTGQPPAPSRLWFGDSNGNLWALDENMNPADGAPVLVDARTDLKLTILSTPVLYKDPKGGLTVLFGVFDSTGKLPSGLWGYDPANRNTASIATGITYVNVLSPGVTNGVIWAGGNAVVANGNLPSQVFGIRVDELPQALRDFIIESQLMQDPDQNATGGSSDPNNPIPPSVARYQTHLTVVDDQKNPQPYEPVKIWADKSNTVITVDGRPFTIGPGDTQYASVKTGLDGSLVIVSNATDLFASPLRVWAGFMDPYERIVVNPDQEFHARVTTAHANANDDDPDKANLQTAHNYNGQPLFTDGEKSQGQPQNCSDAVGQMNKGVGLSGDASKATFVKVMRAITGGYSTAEVGATPQPDKYLAYADLTGASHFPTNIPALRPAKVAAPVGLRFARPQDGKSSPPAFAAIHHTDALAAIDALPPTKPDAPWLKPSSHAQGAVAVFSGRRSDDFFTDFWNWLKGAVQQAVAFVTHIIVAVGEDIVVGIRMIVNGVEQVFKAVIKMIEDIAAAIGLFFQMLEKLIEDVIAALSVLFNFGEIMWTHRWLVKQFNQQVSGLAATIKNNVVPAVDGFFKKGECAIKGFFDTLRRDLSPNDQINNLKGSGATPHSMFTIGPKDGTATSHAPQCTWGMQKLKSGLPAATDTGHARPAQTAGDPLGDFINGFMARLTGDGNLSAVLNQLKSDFGNLFKANSAQQFLITLLLSLLDILETLLIGALAITNAFVDGFLALIGDAINAVISVLNTQIQIPVLTWLYEKLFGEPLTFLNAATLVAAIPVTMIFRVVEGQYPSQALPSVAATRVSSPTAASPVVQKVLACFNAMFAFAQGLCSAIGDSMGKKAPPNVDKMTAGLSLFTAALGTPAISSDSPSTDDWVVFGLGSAWALAGVFTLENFQLADEALLPWCTGAMGCISLIAVIVAFVENGHHDVTANAGLANGIASAVPAMFNPVKLAPEPGPLFVGLLDFFGGITVAITDLIMGFNEQAPA